MPLPTEVIDIANLPQAGSVSGKMFTTLTDNVTGKTYKVAYETLRMVLGIPDPLGITGEATLTTIPGTDGYEIYNVTTAGIYPHFKDDTGAGIEVTQEDLNNGWVQFWVVGGVAKKVITPISGATPIFNNQIFG